MSTKAPNAGDVGDDAGQLHARLRGPRSSRRPRRRRTTSNCSRGSRPGLASSARMSVQRRQADAVASTYRAGAMRLRSSVVAQQVRHRAAEIRRPSAPRPGSSRGARRWRPAGSRRARMRRKPAACSKALGPRRGTFSSVGARGERAVLVAVGHDVPRPARGRGRRRSESSCALAVFSSTPTALTQLATTVVERALERVLVDVVLVLPDADGLGVDLHQLGERVHQAPADGDRAAHGEVLVGELLARDLGGGVDRGAALVDHAPPAPRPGRPRPRTKASVSRPAVPLPMAMASTAKRSHQLAELRGGLVRWPAASRSAGRRRRCPAACPGGRGRPPCSRCGNPGRSPARSCRRAAAASSSSRRFAAKTRIASRSARSLRASRLSVSIASESSRL